MAVNYARLSKGELDGRMFPSYYSCVYGIRPPQKEILGAYRHCCKKLGKTPGIRLFCQVSGVSPRQIYYYWPHFDDLVKEAGAQPNRLPTPLTDDQILCEYARVCLHLGRIPRYFELHHTARKIGARVASLRRRFGNVEEFDRRFRAWLLEAPAEFKSILALPGWRRDPGLPPMPLERADHFWLPSGLEDLGSLAQMHGPPPEPGQGAVEEIFDSRCGEAFCALGFEVNDLPPPMGSFRPAQAPRDHPREEEAAGGATPGSVRRLPWPRLITALTPEHTYGLILECEARQGEFAPPRRRDREPFACVQDAVAELRRQDEVSRTYFALIGPSFQETDLAATVRYFVGCGLAGVTLLSAAALRRLVENSIQERAAFTLARFEATWVGNNLIL